MATRPPRRQAAIRCTQTNSVILNTVRGRPGPMPAPLPVIRPQRPAEQCVFCHQNVDIDQDEIEMCRNCHHAAHHECATNVLGPNDRQCRDLCGYTPPQHQRAQFLRRCPHCNHRFRLNDAQILGRWLDIFQTRAWVRYINQRQGSTRRYPHQMVPSVDGTNRYFDLVYQPDAERFISQASTMAQAQDPNRTPFICHPEAMIWGATYNNENGAPFRLDRGSFMWSQQEINPNPRQNFTFRNYYFAVHPSISRLAENDPGQRYMFSELNILMHSDRPVWKRFCKIFDNLRLDLTAM